MICKALGVNRIASSTMSRVQWESSGVNVTVGDAPHIHVGDNELLNTRTVIHSAIIAYYISRT